MKIYSKACEGYEMTIEDHYDMMVNYTNSYLVEKGKPENLYIPRKAIDNDINTAWVEGSEGDGIGEVFVIDLLPSDIKSIKIMPGYAKNEKLFLENNRPKQLTFIFFNLLRFDSKIKNENDIRKHKVLCEWQYELKDSREFQEIIIPDFCKKGRTLAIVIKSVYKGTKYSDTAIAEIRFFDERGVDILKEMYDQHQIKHTPASKNKGGQK
jgi:hypothetical protein